MKSAQSTLAIIGGGFCGCVLAANLLRRPPSASTRIVLIERSSSLGRGVAYARGDYPYLLNVPAARMSASSDDVGQLIEYARRFLPRVDGDSYLPRELYGEYVLHFLRAAARAAPRHVQFEHVRGEVSALRLPTGPRATAAPLLLQVGERRIAADRVVLACGEPTSAIKPYARSVADHGAYVRDPHRPELPRAQAVSRSDRCVLLIGTGLTMVDMAVATAANNPDAQIIALSRHGLLPAAQHRAVSAVLSPGLNLGAVLGGRSVRELVAAVRALSQSVQRQGGDWREVVTGLRECTPLLWQGWGEGERRRFLRHVRAYWDVHRHRMPPEFGQQLAALRANGRLQVHAGHIQALIPHASRIEVRWRERGGSATRCFHADRVVDCSGAEHRLRGTTDLLWRQLLEAGIAAPDCNGLGLRTGPLGALIDAGGRRSDRIFYLGPMLRAAYWEATAVGELRARAEALAASLAHSDGESDHDGLLIDSARAVV
jgi:uncharacterized NAD(P)/FAD-binding protein YdhS